MRKIRWFRGLFRLYVVWSSIVIMCSVGWYVKSVISADYGFDRFWSEYEYEKCKYIQERMNWGWREHFANQQWEKEARKKELLDSREEKVDQYQKGRFILELIDMLGVCCFSLIAPLILFVVLFIVSLPLRWVWRGFAEVN